MKAINVLLITSGYPNRWKPYAGIYVRRQVEILEKTGQVKFTVLTTGDSRKGLRVNTLKYLWLVTRVLWVSLFGRFDIIHAHAEFPAGTIGLIPKFLTKKPFIITVHGGVMHSLGKRHRIFKGLICHTFNQADKIITVSKYLKDQVAIICGLKVDGIEVIDMGVDLDQFRPISKMNARIKLSLEDSGCALLLYVGNLKKGKGVNHLLEALNILQEIDDCPPVLLNIVGGGEEEDYLIAQTNRLGLNSVVRFAGVKGPAEVPVWMAAADLVIVPSLFEGFGLVAIEAMACGTPVIAARSGGLPEIIVDGANGWLVDPGDPNDLAKKLYASLNDKSIITDRSENSLQTAREHDSVYQALKVKQIYEAYVS